ncbi:hypothetical protein [Streptomyces abyssomicinicus]|uniref:hypothetical protein n=1 Tax=Streptomyces abyssomicinicus TaxID=574929 RepID=UPI00124FEDD5|nr:hypothetical protein [Streptomyces abyssomicinicus]
MATVTFRGPVLLGEETVRCPGSTRTPDRLTLIGRGETTYATCGDKHRPAGGGRRAACWFPLEGVPDSALAALSKAKPGRIRATLPSGTVLQGRLAETGQAAANSTTGRAAQALAQKTGAPAKPGPAKPKKTASGGSLTAAFNAVAAVAGAVGQTAAAVGQVASAGASVADSAGRVAVAGIGAADNSGARRHSRRMARNEGSEDASSE